MGLPLLAARSMTRKSPNQAVYKGRSSTTLSFPQKIKRLKRDTEVGTCKLNLWLKI